MPTLSAGLPALPLRPPDPDLTAADPRAPRRRAVARAGPGRMLHGFLKAWAEVAALLFPVDCICCGVEDTVLCAACARRIRLLCKSPFRAEQQAPALVETDGSVKLGVVPAGAYRDELAQGSGGLQAFSRCASATPCVLPSDPGTDSCWYRFPAAALPSGAADSVRSMSSWAACGAGEC